MLTLREKNLFDTGLLDKGLFKQLEQQLHTAERVPAAEVIESDACYTIYLELPGVDKTSIDVKATDRSLVISAERKQPQNGTAPLISEFRYGTWSRSFRFPNGIEREALEASYQGGLLTVVAPKAQTLTTVQVKVES
ncbi:Hsp20/alpha crystallin family protein [Cyanobium sp. HWJ4-Hawea]|uniref:Hsp20/alpha crystallin family protein n=1 Tax=Cyanobium sp. HWJ4-Hawea TaxID=2823713 RepID=UPI0020CDDBE3|nr:Hsp20/alpha crystallin family protein [Cyanobium sp. HWJ4-Hawea]MCP9808188.1 Hsp20/alpha crystallin family protein [Cyanobium sp. HWJ4-Hawea]